MAITLASDSWGDAEITDGIGRGDLAAAARLWVRHWPTALTAARLYVERAEVPGLAAEALIGTITLIATGRGPREDVARFVADSVRELGEDDGDLELGPDTGIADVFVSPRLTAAFADLPAEDQQLLRTADDPSHRVEDVTSALTVLQTSYLTTHLGDAPSRECRPTHVAMVAVAGDSARTGFPDHYWLHLSTCAWCTEAFHEVAFTNVALRALIAPRMWDVVIEPEPLFDADPVPVAAAEPVPARRFGEIPAAGVLELHDDDTSLIPVALDAPPEPPVEENAGARVLFLTGRRRILAAGIVAAAVAVGAFALTQGNDPTTPASANAGQPTPSTSTSEPGPTAEPSRSQTVAVAGPRRKAADAITAGATAGAAETPRTDPTTAQPGPTKQPTKQPTQKPTDPSPSTPAPSTPTPSATPTKHCNPLQHLLGFC